MNDNKLTIWRAVLQLPDFTRFEATGLSDADTFKTLRLALEKHATQDGRKLPLDWWRAHYEQITLEQIDVGVAYRDGEVL